MTYCTVAVLQFHDYGLMIHYQNAELSRIKREIRQLLEKNGMEISDARLVAVQHAPDCAESLGGMREILGSVFTHLDGREVTDKIGPGPGIDAGTNTCTASFQGDEVVVPVRKGMFQHCTIL